MKKIILFFILLFAGGFIQAQNLSVIVTSTTSCMDDGTATGVVSGGVPPYLYEWTHFSPSFVTQFTPNISNLVGGYYQLKVTDAAGTIAYGYADVQTSFNIEVITTPDTCLNAVGTAEVSIISGTIVLPLTYLWSNNATTQLVTGLGAGDYGVTVTMGNGCFVHSDVADSVGMGGPYDMGYVFSVANFLVDITTTDANCTNGTATPNITGGQGPFTYEWLTNPVQTTMQATNLPRYTLSYLVTTDGTGCIDSTMFFVNSGPSNFQAGITQTADTCGSGHGSLIAYGIGGLPPYTYLWSNGNTSASISNLIGGIYYTVTITDANGCDEVNNALLFTYSPLTITTSLVPSSCSASTGTITANVNGGQPPYNYLWQTIPAQITATASNLAAGSYNVRVSDQNGCQINASANLIDNSNLAVTITETADQCNNSVGTATVNVTGGQPGYTYSWNTIPVQTTATISGLSYGVYKVTVTDALGCIREIKASIGNQTPITLTTSTTNASCKYIADGAASVVPSGGTPPYTYNWVIGNNTPSINSILPGSYFVSVTDAIGCVNGLCLNVGYNSILPCAVELNGMVYNDVDSNCILSNQDRTVGNVWIKCNSNGPYQMTDNYSNYDFVLPAPGSYGLDLTVPTWYDWVCNSRPLVVNIPSLNTIVTQDLPIRGNAVDMEISSTSIIAARPGFLYTNQVTYLNQGSLQSGPGDVIVYFDSSLTFVNSNPSPVSFNPITHELRYQFTDLFSNVYKKVIDITYQVPSNLAIGNTLTFFDSIVNYLNNDTVIYNNYYALHELVVGSFDPNEIRVTPEGYGSQGEINASDSVLTYTVRFQNTGNYMAQNVEVKVQTDPDLDLSTFRFLASSHKCKIEADVTGIVTFTFIGINLPDTVMDEAASHGYLTYTLQQKQGLSQGTQFNCSADIYFDFNAPVATNTTLNTLTGIKLPGQPTSGVSLYPNPASDIIYLQSSEENYIREINLYDAMGRLIIQNTAFSEQTSLFELNIQSLQLTAGIYFVSVDTKNGLQMLKFIKK